MKTKKVIMAVTAFSLVLGASTASWAGSAAKPSPQGPYTAWSGDRIIGWVVRIQGQGQGQGQGQDWGQGRGSVTRWVVDNGNGRNNGRVTMQRFH